MLVELVHDANKASVGRFVNVQASRKNIRIVWNRKKFFKPKELALKHFCFNTFVCQKGFFCAHRRHLLTWIPKKRRECIRDILSFLVFLSLSDFFYCYVSSSQVTIF